MGTPIVNLDQIIDQRVVANVDIQSTLDVKQEVVDLKADVEVIAGQIATDVTQGKVELEDYTTAKKSELDTKKVELEGSLNTYNTAKVDEYDANAADRLQEYDTNATEKLNAYNTNDSTKLEQYNENHIERLEDLNYAYADRIVDMLNTKRLLGMVDQFFVKTTTQMAQFLSTDDPDYIYYVNRVKLELGVDYTVYDTATIELTTPINPYDVVVQVNTRLLKLATEHVHQGMIGPPGLIPEIEFELVNGDLVCNIVGYREGTEQIEWSLG
jgi:hypothetical protein